MLFLFYMGVDRGKGISVHFSPESYRPVLAVLQVNEGSHEGVDPGLVGTQLSRVCEVVVSQCFPKILSHVLETGVVLCYLRNERLTTMYVEFPI